MLDIRDLRDPEKLGHKLLYEAEAVRRTYGEKIPLSEVWEIHVSKLTHPEYHGELMGSVTAAKYKAELETRTDVYAKSVLDAMNSGTKPNQDPYGE